MVNVASALVARDEPAEAVDPGEGALDASSVAAQLLTGLDAAAGDAGCDPATTAGLSAASMVVSLVGVELVWPTLAAACFAADWWDAVKQLVERHAVVGVGTSQDESERDAVLLSEQIALRAEPASIDRVRPGLVAPLLAASDALPMHARLQSIGASM